ncbi:MAG: flippase-like domain-containing protein [Peptostreptococcus stomatis]|uniref:lysylphosphatidylglycerol synthase transmembrane domain-containing protein n=1 Tax=Peptostreptococcus stomatis TaxID=341694 RepID=UPI001A39A3B6|nr:lysylphosphatidylglycerol synthase transmembrane domain-containing protein [Peptostreptococcus stomatis]MBL6466030.1 flippase-like domain-containing protein [Peptostreptococcus stomatis]
MEGLKNKKSQFIGITIMVVLMVFTISQVLKGESVDSIMRALRSVKPKYILVGIGMMLVYASFEGINIWLIVKGLKQKTSIFKCIGYGFVGFYFSSITPSASGGQPAQVYFMKKDGISVTSSSLTLMLILFTHQLVVVIYALIGVLLNTNIGGSQLANTLLLAFGFITNALLLIGIIMLVYWPKLVFKILNFFGLLLHRTRIIKNREKIEKKISSSVEEYERGAIYMRNNPILILKVTLLTVVQISLLYAVPYVIYKGFGLSGYSVMDLILMQAILNIAVSSLPLPGGVGASESLFLGMFRVFYGKKLLIPGMLLTRISNFYSVLIISGIISLVMYLWPSKNQVVEDI